MSDVFINLSETRDATCRGGLMTVCNIAWQQTAVWTPVPDRAIKLSSNEIYYHTHTHTHKQQPAAGRNLCSTWPRQIVCISRPGWVTWRLAVHQIFTMFGLRRAARACLSTQTDWLIRLREQLCSIWDIDAHVDTVYKTDSFITKQFTYYTFAASPACTICTEVIISQVNIRRNQHGN